MTDPQALAANNVFDFEHPAVRAFVKSARCYRSANLTEAVERLHDKVRDDIDYNVFNVPLHPDLSASEVLDYGSGFCLHKSILFAAGCRSLGVPAVLCSDTVTNHVGDPAMHELVGGTEFLHWYTKIRLNGRWVKAAPIFNTLLCMLYGIEVLRFDATGGDIAQPYHHNTRMQFRGNQHVYVSPTGEELITVIQRMHPNMVTTSGKTPSSYEMFPESPERSPNAYVEA